MSSTLYLPRQIDAVLRSWQEEPDRKPLVLRGARQTGKSTSVRELGKRFALFLELNLERQVDLALVRSCSSPRELLVALAARHNLASFPPSTLLFLDEIQQSPEAVGWLRFFKEEHPGLSVIAAGSFLEVRLQERGFSFPVGRVTFRTLHPFSFLEFLRAIGQDVLAGSLFEAHARGEPPVAALHAQALSRLRDYLLVGGMPEAVATWSSGANPADVRRVQADLVQALAEDINKYRGARDLVYLEAAFASLKDHYGQRFHYENFAPGFRSGLMKVALEKLEAAMVIARAWPTSSLALPLRIRPRSAPKLLPLDIGVALYTMGVPFDALRTLPLESVLDGRAAEMFAGQQIRSAQSGPPEPLHFWVRETARANAEVDFLLPGPGVPVPVEVKAGAAGTLRSVHQFLWRSKLDAAVRIHTGTRVDERLRTTLPDGEIEYRLLSVPLYLAELVPSLVTSFEVRGRAR